MEWRKYSTEELTKYKNENIGLICQRSFDTGYAKCRPICCNKCNRYESCTDKIKCTANDIKECIYD